MTTTPPTADPVAYKLGPVSMDRYHLEVERARKLRDKDA